MRFHRFGVNAHKSLRFHLIALSCKRRLTLLPVVIEGIGVLEGPIGDADSSELFVVLVCVLLKKVESTCSTI